MDEKQPRKSENTVFPIITLSVIIIIIIIIMSLFKEDNIFIASTNLTYGPHKTWLNTYYLQTVKIYIYTKSSRIL